MMGKTQKFSKGHPLGFLPDYRHGVETMGEPKGLGIPAGTEPKRKCISLNTDEGGEVPGFNVPQEVFLLPRMSASDRKELEMRLREELKQVRDLQNRLFSGGAAVSMSGGTALAPRGDVDAKRKDGKHKRSNTVQSGRGMPPSIAPPVVSSTNYAASFKQCGNVLKFLMTTLNSGPFLAPVDVLKLNIPDYFEIIKHPMDLGTIQKKLNAGMYFTPWEFAADVRLTFNNAMTYNPVNNAVHQMARALSKGFESRWKSIEKKLPWPEEKPSVREPSKKCAIKKDIIEKEDPSEKKPSKKGAHKKDIFEKEDAVGKPVLQPKKRKASPLVQDAPVAPVVHTAVVVEDAPVVQTATKMMTDKQKVDLSVRLQSFGGLIPDHVVEFIRRHVSDDNEADEDELELDMNALSDDTLFELQNLLDDYDMVNQSENHTIDEPREVEFQSEYRLINSSVHDAEGNEFVEEDVDIGGNDPPLLTYPPMLFESETADRSSRHSTSSSSSSDSASSSSDSDSSSSSGSDLDVKVPPPNTGAKENALSVVSLDQENDSLSTLNLPEQSTDPVPISADDEGCEKDPEKVRREREELERLQREERARLQAEAKAVDDARKRAEAAAAAEAATEAKRQRELEREAARRALQQMEKTVEINEGSLFLKDLEMLGTVTGEQLPCSVGQTSPTHTPEVLGFQLGSNPLEQLGLYMKNDDEEDEEGGYADEPTVDVEEGEID